MLLLAAVAVVLGLFCLLMPVRALGYNPVTRSMNEGFDEVKAARNMWVVRVFGVVFLVMAALFVAVGV